MFADHLTAHFAAVRAGLMMLVGALAEDDLDFRPAAGGYSVRELLLHIAHEELGEVQHGISRSLAAWPDAFEPAAFPTVTDLSARLESTRAQTTAFLAQLTDEALAGEVETPWGTRGTLLALLTHVLEHEIHHRGELSLIAGMLGRQGLDA